MTDLDQARAEAAEQERDVLAAELERVRDILAAVIPNAIQDDTAADLAQQARARVAELTEAARRAGAADGILLARDHVAPDDRPVLTSLARQVRAGRIIPTATAEEGAEK